MVDHKQVCHYQPDVGSPSPILDISETSLPYRYYIIGTKKKKKLKINKKTLESVNDL